jgi:hypothetical protein
MSPYFHQVRRKKKASHVIVRGLSRSNCKSLLDDACVIARLKAISWVQVAPILGAISWRFCHSDICVIDSQFVHASL